MIYEIRVYRCVPGRLPALLNRFQNITLKLWEKHGIRQAGFWTTLVGESNQDLTYMLAWESLAERDQKWGTFSTDPEWISKRAETEKDGPIVQTLSNQLLTPTAFSSVKQVIAPGIDHVVHTVHDLDAAGELYTALGFTVGARNRHPWGTHNRIIQFPGAFLELLEVAAPGKISEPSSPREYSFGAFNRDFAKQGEGLSMLVLRSADAAADAERFRQAGVGDFELFRFEREGRRPDGTPVHLAFSLAFAQDHASPRAGFFACQHHYPENFWNPDFQRHGNGAAALAGVILVAREPARHRGFLDAFTGAPAQDWIELLTPDAFQARTGDAPEAGEGMRLAALRVRVGDMNGIEARLAGLQAHKAVAGFVVGARQAHGATLVFEPG